MVMVGVIVQVNRLNHSKQFYFYFAFTVFETLQRTDTFDFQVK